MPERRKTAAYVAPMLAFIGLLAVNVALKKIGGQFWLRASEYWIYPVQTVLCGVLLIWFRREYEFHGLRRVAFSLVVGAVVFVLWISPQQFLGFAARTVGFNPDLFSSSPLAYWFTVILRFLRLAVVVPFVEEIFWRGFLLRFLIDEDFTRVRFGTFSWVSFLVVTVAFGFSHLPKDWIAALITGAIYNGVAYRTKSLGSCILTHAVTNLLLGFWIMQTGQWGFW
jgi:CAAX prenyl protease-like protein